MKDRSGATTPRTHQTTRSGHPESDPPLYLGFVPDSDPLPTSDTHMDRHLELHRLTVDPAAALLTAIAEWMMTTAGPLSAEPADQVAMVYATDLVHGGTVAEGIDHRQAAILTQLLRSDTQLRTPRTIPSAPAGAHS